MRQSTETAGRPDEDSGSLQIETEGRGRVAEISASARRVPWFRNLLQVLWAAGPATFLAMQGGYWLGFGEFAPARNVIRRLGLYPLTLLQESLDLSDLAIQRAIQAAPAAWLFGVRYLD